MATASRAVGRRTGGALLAAIAVTACSVGNLSYRELERDLDALVRVEGSGDSQRLVYQDSVEMSPWYARAAPLWPLKWLLVPLFGATTRSKLENPSNQSRELMAALAPKAGADPLLAAAVVQRLIRVAELDASALNRIVALDGLEVIALAQGIDLVAGLGEGELQALPGEQLQPLLDGFRDLRPAARKAPWPLAEQTRYEQVLDGLSARPLSTWSMRVALVADLSAALQAEPEPLLRARTDAALARALGHAIRWTVMRSLQGQERVWVDVRLRALETLHRAGGADGVPLLLALLASSPTEIAEGKPRFDPHPAFRLRLIHICGQLNQERALRAVRLPGREAWEPVAPVDFLVEMVLTPDAFLSPFQVPAQEALSRCLQRPRLQLDPTSLSPAGADVTEWVRLWYDEHRKSS